jgi:ADP-ribose pyrophosphatase YjhB (NUDIX family)
MKSRASREYPNRPIVGVGAVIVDTKARRVVLVRRAAPPLEGAWSVPGGVVEVGETLRSAAEREALEETGLTVEAGELLDVFDRIIPGDDGRTRYHYVLVDFLCLVRSGELRSGADAAEAEWVSEDQLEKYKLEKPALNVIRRAFRST